jgi:circadian clock protein KaiB
MADDVDYSFRLYVVGNSPNSVAALANLKALCLQYLPDHHQIEVVDVFKEPMLALSRGILLTPTLEKVSPAPSCRIVGTLSEPLIVLQTLGVST